MNDRTTLDASDIAAAFDWWRDAGVDLDFSDDATDWLAVPEVTEDLAVAPAATRKPSEEAQVQPAEKTDLLGDAPPQTLEAFREFWMTAPGLDAIGPRGRVAPRGPQSPEVMILVTDPEEHDGEQLLSGPHGALVAKMLKAMGFAPEQTYFASALPRYMPMTDGQALARQGYRELLLHHIGLVQPQRIVAFGANLPPLLAHDVAQAALSLREINHDGRSIPLMVSEGLESMMAMPRLKARFWHRWLDWTAN